MKAALKLIGLMLLVPGSFFVVLGFLARIGWIRFEPVGDVLMYREIEGDQPLPEFCEVPVTYNSQGNPQFSENSSGDFHYQVIVTTDGLHVYEPCK